MFIMYMVYYRRGSLSKVIGGGRGEDYSGSDLEQHGFLSTLGRFMVILRSTLSGRPTGGM